MDGPRQTLAKLAAWCRGSKALDGARLRGEVKRSFIVGTVAVPALTAMAILGGAAAITYGATAIFFAYLLVEQALKRLRRSLRIVDWYFRDP